MKKVKRRNHLFVAFMSAGILVMALLAGVGQGTSSTVHAVSGDGERIAEANGDPVGINGAPCAYATIGDAINAASDGDTIYIPSGNMYNEVLGIIDKDLTFVAALADCSTADPAATNNSVVIDGGGNYEGTQGGGLAATGSNRNVTFTHVTLQNASAVNGGVLYVDQGATLTLEDCTVRGGTAGATGGGVRVYRDGALTLRDETIINANLVTGTINSGGAGVAVYHGAMTMTQNSNVGLGGGGGNASADSGGGIWLQSSRLYLDDSFVVGNQATNQGGGVLASGTSLIELHGFSGIGFWGSPTTFSNTATHGGGVYISGLSGLVAHDNSKIAGNAADFDGGGVYADLGAYVTLRDESEVLSNTATSDGAGVFLTGDGTRLNMIFGGGRIAGNQAGSFGGRGGGGIYVTGAASVYADSGRIAGNTAGIGGGGIYVAQDGIVTPTSVILNNGTQVEDNTATLGGGLHIRDDGPRVVVDDSLIENNEAVSGNGGGVFIDDSSHLTLMNGSVVSANVAEFDGGGLHLLSGTVRLDDAGFLWNTARLRNGGGIYQASGTFTATDPDIRFNTAGEDGGGIYHAGGDLIMEAVNEHSYLAVNDAIRGGGLYDESGEIVAIQALGTSSFNLNTNYATDLGGGAFLTNTTALNLFGDFIISTNEADTVGGAIYANDSQFTLNQGTSSVTPEIGGANTAQNGGAIYAANGAYIALYRAQLGTLGSSNSATLDGGGVYADDSTVLLRDTQVINNHAGGDGGGVYVENGSQLIVDTSYFYSTPACDPRSLPAGTYCSEVRENTASGWGAGIYVYQSTATIENTAFLDNVGLSSGVSPGAAIDVNDALVKVTNGLFSGNGENGNAAVHVYTDGRYHSRHSTYAGNQGNPLFAVNSSVVTLTNNIVWDNASDALYQSGVTLTASCNDTQALLAGPNNISVDPKFITTTRGAYRLTWGSPAVDACTGVVNHDLEHTNRPINADLVASPAEFDMGAFERWVHLALPLGRREAP